MLVVFDFDGTLTASDVTVLLGAQRDEATRREMTGIVQRARNGDMGFAESIRSRARLLEGLPEARVENAYEKIQFRPGAVDLLGALSRTDHHVAIVTGSFREAVEAALQREGAVVDSVVANTLPTKNGALTGEVEGPLVDSTKDEAFEELAISEGIDVEDSVVVGDGATDLPMLKLAGTAVGYRPASVLHQHCDVVVHSLDRLSLLFTERGIVE